MADGCSCGVCICIWPCVLAGTLSGLCCLGCCIHVINSENNQASAPLIQSSHPVAVPYKPTPLSSAILVTNTNADMHNIPIAAIDDEVKHNPLSSSDDDSKNIPGVTVIAPSSPRN